MRNFVLLGALMISMLGQTFAQVAINTDGSPPDNSAMLDVKSASKGLLIPRMTLADRNSISLPAQGLMIFQTDNTPGYYCNSGTSGAPVWIRLGDLTLPYSGSISTSGTAFYIDNTGSGIGVWAHGNTGVRGTSSEMYGVSGLGVHGVHGESSIEGGYGVSGFNTFTTASGGGVIGQTNTPAGRGVHGMANSTTGANYGIYGESESTSGYGGYGTAPFTGLKGVATGSSGANYGIYGSSNSISGYGVYGFGPLTGIKGETSGGIDINFGVYGESGSVNGRGIYGKATAAEGYAYGVQGTSASTTGIGVYGGASSTTGANIGVYGYSNSTTGYSGYFIGNKFHVSGNVGIGTTNTDCPLVIQAPDNASRNMVLIRNGSGEQRIQMRQNSNGSGGIWVYDGLNTNTIFLYGDGESFILGNLGIGTNNPGYKLQVGAAGDGSQARANAWNLLSDARLKRDFTGLADPLSMVEKINGYYFYWNTGIDRTRQIGFSAQEVLKVVPEAVSKGEDGYFSIDYGKMAPLLLEAIKELKAENDSLRSEHKKISARVDKLESILGLRAGK